MGPQTPEARGLGGYIAVVYSGSFILGYILVWAGFVRKNLAARQGMGYIWFVYFAAMALAFWFAMTLMYNGQEDRPLPKNPKPPEP